MEELHAQSARELLSSAFTRRKSTETRSKSARNAIPSFPSKMLFRKSKDSSRVREYFSTPSFFMPESVLRIKDQKALRRYLDKGGVFVVFPSLSVLSSPSSWASALSSADYVAVVGDRDIPEFASFAKALDNIVFSPVPRRLAGAVMVKTPGEAIEYAKATGSDDISIIAIGDVQ